VIDMWPYLAKVLVSALILVGAAELGKRSAFAGAVLISLPLSTVLAMTWLYLDTGDAHASAALAEGVAWLVLPSLALFVVMPWAILRAGWGYWPSLAAGCVATALCYGATWALLRRFGVTP
jgi:hypothetical protein